MDFWARLDGSDFDELTRRWLAFAADQQRELGTHRRQPNEYVLRALNKAMKQAAGYDDEEGLFTFVAGFIERDVQADIRL